MGKTTGKKYSKERAVYLNNLGVKFHACEKIAEAIKAYAEAMTVMKASLCDEGTAQSNHGERDFQKNNDLWKVKMHHQLVQNDGAKKLESDIQSQFSTTSSFENHDEHENFYQPIFIVDYCSGDEESVSAVILYNLGLAHLKKGSLTKAFNFFELSLSVVPFNPRLGSTNTFLHVANHYHLGSIFYENSMQNEAVKMLEQAIAYGREALENNLLLACILSKIGYVLMKMGCIVDSLAAYDEALQVYNSYPTFCLVGFTEEKANMVDSAPAA